MKGLTLFLSNYKGCSILFNNPINIIKTKKLIVTYAFQLCQPYSKGWIFPLDFLIFKDWKKYHILLMKKITYFVKEEEAK